MTENVLKPRVFVGSSREGLEVAEAIHVNLSRVAECRLWTHAFKLSGSTLNELMRSLRDSDFGIFVFSPDDVTTMRNEVGKTVRDNVLFELGLFIGRLGPERCFFLIPEGSSDLRLPSDLAGITPGYYESGRADGNLISALGPVCTLIKQQMNELRTFQDSPPAGGIKKPASSKSENVTNAKSEKAAAASETPTLSARFYKKGILVKGTHPSQKEILKGLSGRWNPPLAGWILPRSKQGDFEVAFPAVTIEDDTNSD
ncbi:MULTISPECIES: TIR domain-containing protein [Rhizobium]|uniref:CD-NTase-associated protein 12/Pycsar effector protein TIR domain-containing protein n=1 Tax=Rhizobium esperanzae TaxID=1967781 RepID=A0A7W6XYH8_9HYPH|nr:MULTISPECIES: nucleotide-binding protein [Rhizobium]MBB4440784.1 hypothetical protein [Rhizobium esperanzae]MDH6203417.1 hypothetical protein [Rhizobium leguminosarum]